MPIANIIGVTGAIRKARAELDAAEHAVQLEAASPEAGDNLEATIAALTEAGKLIAQAIQNAGGNINE